MANDSGQVTLRAATMEDEARILGWQQDPRTRSYMRNPEIPDAATHHAWMERKLADKNAVFQIIVHRGDSAGVLRLDPVENDRAAYEVAILVDPAKHRLGIGSCALGLVTRMFPDAQLIAHILAGNEASHRLFASAGFVLRSESGVYERSPSGLPTTTCKSRAKEQ